MVFHPDIVVKHEANVLSDTELVDLDFTAQKSSKTTTPFFKNNEFDVAVFRKKNEYEGAKLKLNNSNKKIPLFNGSTERDMDNFIKYLQKLNYRVEDKLSFVGKIQIIKKNQHVIKLKEIRI